MDRLLSVIRFDSKSASESAHIDKEDYEAYEEVVNSEDSSYSPLLRRLGYSTYLWTNLGPYLFLLLALSCTYAVFCLSKVIKNKWFTWPQVKQQLKPHAFEYINLLVRFGYEVYLEFCICILLSLSIVFKLGDFLVALLLMWLLIVATGMIFVLFYKGGPYLRKGEVAYEKRTLHNFLLCWQVRKMTLDPDALEAQIQEKALMDK